MLSYPFAESAVRALKAGDAVSVNGRIRTGRDRFHKYFADGGKLPCDFRDGALFHFCPEGNPFEKRVDLAAHRL